MAQPLLLQTPLSHWRTHTNCDGHGLASQTIQWCSWGKEAARLIRVGRNLGPMIFDILIILKRRMNHRVNSLTGNFVGRKWHSGMWYFYSDCVDPTVLISVSPTICTIKTLSLTPGSFLAWARALLNAWHKVASNPCWILSIVHLFSQAMWSRDWSEGSPTGPHWWLLAFLLSFSAFNLSSPGRSGVRKVSSKE